MSETFAEREERVIAEQEEKQRDFAAREKRVIGEQEAIQELEQDETPGILADIGRGATRAFVFDWWSSLLKSAGDLDEAAGRRFGKIDFSLFDGDGIGFDPFVEGKDVSPFRLAGERADVARDALVDEPERFLGQMTETLSTFAINFVGPGKLKYLKKLKDMGRWGQTASFMAQGAVADFTVFEGDAGNLSDLLIEVDNVVVNNAVTQFLASSSEQNADITALEGRLRNALEGVIIGGVIDGVIGGVRAIVRTRRAMKDHLAAKEEAKFIKEREDIMEVNGSKEDPAVELGFTEEFTENVNRVGTDATAATPDSQFHTVKMQDDVGEFFAVVDRVDDTFVGGMQMRVRGDTWTITDIGVGPAERGKGFQILLEGIDAGFAAGVHMVSDTKITKAAAKFYRKLEAEGYTIKKNENFIEEGGSIVSTDSRPLFEIISAPPGVGASRVSSKVIKLGSKTSPEDLAREIDESIRTGKTIELDAVSLADGESFRIFMQNAEEAVRASLRSLDTVANSKTLARAQENLKAKFGPTSAEKLTRSLANDVEGNLAARIVTSDILSASTNKRLIAMARKEATGQLTDAQKASAFRLWKLASALDAHARGSRAEVGRALQAMSTTKAAREGSSIDFQEILKENQFIGKFEDLMDSIRRNSDNPAALAEINKLSVFTRARQVLQEIFYGNLLGAMSTEIINIVGNTGKVLEAILVRGTVHGYYGIKQLLTGTVDAGAVAEIKGYVHGLKVFRADTFRFNIKLITDRMDEVGFKISTASREERSAFFQNQKGLGKAAVIEDNVVVQEAEELGNFYKALLTGRGQIDNLTKFEATGGTRAHAIQYSLPDDFADGTLAMKAWHQGLRAITGTIGAGVRLPSKTILGVDEIFKNLNHSLEVNSIAFRNAQNLVDIGVESGEIAGIAERMIRENESQVVDQSIEFARKQTFQQSLGTVGKTIEGVLNKHPLLRFTIPFVRTPTNIAKDAISWVPGANVMTRRFWTEMSEGGIVRDRAVAKLMLSVGLGTYIWDQWDRGLITGQRADTNSERLGKPSAYSIFLFGLWRRYNRLDPLGMTIGFMADIAQLQRDFDLSEDVESELNDLVYGFLAAASENFISKTYMRGVSELIGAFDDAKTGNTKGLESYGASMLINFLPFVGSNFERRRAAGQDDFARYAFGELDRLVARIPSSDRGPAKLIQGAINAIPGVDIDFRDRADLGVRMDVLGRPVKERLSQTTIMALSEDGTNLDKQLAELEITLPDVSRSINGTKLSGKQFSRWQWLRGNQAEILGKKLPETLTDTFNSPVYNLLPIYKQQRAIVKIFSDYRDKALDLLLQQDTELAAQVEAAELIKREERTVDPSGLQQLIDQAAASK